MGTPEFAVLPLQTLLAAGCEVCAVVTVADKAAGRGHQLQMSPVKQCAVAHHIPVLQPEKLRDTTFLEQLRAFNADLFVVVAFRMLPAAVFTMPHLGTINLHASLLPQYRGAAPINWAVINGERESGVTTFFIEQEIDKGKIIFQESVPLAHDTTAGALHDMLMQQGAALLLKTVLAIESGNYPQTEQAHQAEEYLKKAPKIFKEHCEIQWQQPCEQVYNFVRGLSPYPAAYTWLQGQRLKILSGTVLLQRHTLAAGEAVLQNGELLFACGDGFFVCGEVQLEGKRRMSAAELLRGWRNVS